jgi:hypothetical protein
VTGQFSDDAPIVVTNCTTRKRAFGPPVVLPAKSFRKPPAAMAAEWLGLLDRAPRGITAEDLYVGRSFVESKAGRTRAGRELVCCIGWLGPRARAELVPNYDLTVVKGVRAREVA